MLDTFFTLYGGACYSSCGFATRFEWVITAISVQPIVSQEPVAPCRRSWTSMKVKHDVYPTDMNAEIQNTDKTLHRVYLFEKAWRYLCSLVSEVDLLIMGSALVQVWSTWISGLPFLCVERLYPQLIARWKIQPQVRQSRANLRDVLRHIVAQHLMLLMGCVFATTSVKRLDIRLVKSIAERVVHAQLPCFRRLLVDMTVNLMTWEVVFYSSHRFLHTKRLYMTIHKKHHRFKAPVSLCSNYAENIEHVLGNIIPGLSGPVINQVLYGPNLVSHWVWIAFGAWLTNVSHSGYVIPFNPFLHCILTHEYHHKTFYHQLGTLGLMDKILGTDGGHDYKQWKTEVANRVFKDMPYHKAFAQLF